MGCSGDKISTDARRNPTSAEKQNHMQQKLTTHCQCLLCMFMCLEAMQKTLAQ